MAKKQTTINFLKTMIIMVIFGLFLMPFSYSSLMNNLAYGATSSNLNNLLDQKSKLNSDINTKTKQVDQKKKQSTELTAAIKTIDKNISTTESKIQDLQNQIDQTQKDIEETEQQIVQKEQELSNEKAKKNETIRLMYEQNQQNTLYLIIGSKTLSEAIDKVQYFESLENKIGKTIQEINRLKKDLEEKRANLNQKKIDLMKLKNEQEAYKTGLNQQQKEKEIVLSDVNAQKKQLENQIAEAKKLTNQVEAQIAKIQAEMKSSSKRTVMARDRGTSAVGFQWPINYNYLSAYYGDRTPFQTFHTGLDLVNMLGTPVYAAAAGTVIISTDMMTDGHYYGYGKYVVIEHNAKYSSLYGHLMVYNVSAGQEVKTGDVIGYLGNTGWSTGPHLHFEVWEFGQRQNPLNYLP